MKKKYFIVRSLEGIYLAFIMIIGIFAPFIILYSSAYLLAPFKNIGIIAVISQYNVNNLFVGFMTYLGIVISVANIYRQVSAKNREEKERKHRKNQNIYKHFSNVLVKNQNKFKLLDDEKNQSELHKEFLWKKLEKTQLERNFLYTIDNEFIQKNLESILEIEIGEQLLNVVENINEINQFVKVTFLEFDWKKKIDDFRRFAFNSNNFHPNFTNLLLSEIIILPNIIPDLGDEEQTVVSEEYAIEIINDSNFFKNKEELIKKYNKTRATKNRDEKDIIEIYIKKIDFISHLFLDLKRDPKARYSKDEAAFIMEEIRIIVSEIRNLVTLKEKINKIILEINKCSEILKTELKVSKSLFPKEFI